MCTLQYIALRRVCALLAYNEVGLFIWDFVRRMVDCILSSMKLDIGEWRRCRVWIRWQIAETEWRWWCLGSLQN